jgi:hypothetical protein
MRKEERGPTFYLGNVQLAIDAPAWLILSAPFGQSLAPLGGFG